MGSQMTPAEFEWADEQTERAYVEGRIGKITFLKAMRALGYKNMEYLRELLTELDKQRATP